MLEPVAELTAIPQDAPRTRSQRRGKVLARRRPAIFAPLFGVALALGFYERSRPQLGIALAAAGVLVAAWLLRIWATGYRTWVRGSGGVRHLMRAGPYSRVRHPLYVANGVAGAAALVLLGRFELLIIYGPLYALVIAAIVAREEEALTERYGDEHERYRAAVPRFLPVPGRAVARSERTGDFSWQPVRTGLEVWKLVALLVTIAVFFFVGR